ncbi:D-alanine--D-alanine ligase [Marinicella sp. W31]|uniref:D-alanine--D-alanine ligase n=1 Tax=Marinicella sp. W31 TaxID=3023713 RepID=UPI003757C323
MKDYGVIAVVMGGESAERAVSLNSGQAVIASLQRQGHEVLAVDGMPALKKLVAEERVDTVFNILHGVEGENGILAAWLAAEGIRFTGCDHEGGVLSWLKDKAKDIVQQAGLKTPQGITIHPHDNLNNISVPGDGPWIVKPAAEGSSVGLIKVDEQRALLPAIELAFKHCNRVLLEQFVDGMECTVAVVNGQVLPAVSIVPDGVLYDYEAKYESDKTQYHCPSLLDAENEHQLQQDAQHIFNLLCLRGWARIDFLVDQQGERWFLEANTTPGMTTTSLVPKAANAFGWDFDRLVLEILKTSQEYAHE